MHCVIDGLFGEWSDIITVKTMKKLIDGFEKQFMKWLETDKLELLYRGSTDGMTEKVFHSKCDGQGPTVTLIKNGYGHIFGGYASVSWGKGNCWKQAPGSLIFTLTNAYDIPPTKFALRDENTGKAVYHNKSVAQHLEIMIFA